MADNCPVTHKAALVQEPQRRLCRLTMTTHSWRQVRAVEAAESANDSTSSSGYI